MERIQGVVGTVNECAKRLNGLKNMVDIQNRFAEVQSKSAGLFFQSLIRPVENEYRQSKSILAEGGCCIGHVQQLQKDPSAVLVQRSHDISPQRLAR
jgi:exosome complex RNA-binding protein Rrp4